MKKLLFKIMFLLVIVLPASVLAEVNVHISLPPLIVFPAPPAMVVIPETYVYVVPDVQEDLYF